MEMFETPGDGFTVLNVIGRVNSSNAAQIGERLGRLLDGGWRALVIDLARLEHMTSAGFRYLLQAERTAALTHSTMVLCGLSGLTLELFEIGGFLDMFRIAPNRESAIQLIGEGVRPT